MKSSQKEHSSVHSTMCVITSHNDYIERSLEFSAKKHGSQRVKYKKLRKQSSIMI